VLADAGPQGELLPRDVVARTLWSALGAGRRTLLDAREAVGESFPDRFPTAFEACRRYGLDPRREPIPAAPAAHYHMGGVQVDLDGRSSVSGLWAAGEAACTGVHGANRLASNSLLEGLVFGARVARSIDDQIRDARGASGALVASRTALARRRALATEPEAGSLAIESEVRGLMWDAVGLVRTGSGLRAALDRLDTLATELGEAGPTADLVTVARLVATAALHRTESRGAHYRADHPLADASWQRRIVLARGSDGIRIESEPVGSWDGDPRDAGQPVKVCA
jgi:L-aspartate oxidase